uniref:Uncharacterized protein n=1 Tax=Picea sitchensis TaxID=3332 RepID=B8LM62_PICSI|nr:unknown [Picea sitchensis]
MGMSKKDDPFQIVRRLGQSMGRGNDWINQRTRLDLHWRKKIFSVPAGAWFEFSWVRCISLHQWIYYKCHPRMWGIIPWVSLRGFPWKKKKEHDTAGKHPSG